MSPERIAESYGIKGHLDGALAQLVARFNGIEEVTGSTPVRSRF
jgi:hypothetical protein